VKSVSAPPWALSFADLCLLLLGFFVMLHAQSGHQTQVVQGIKQALGGGHSVKSSQHHEIDPAKLFEPGEALLRPQAREQIQALGRHAALSRTTVRIESIGVDRAAKRFDGWELAAARTAAIARTMQAGGLSEKAVTISIPEMAETPGGKQRISIELKPRAR
jgi:flagellar motor protein MotB